MTLENIIWEAKQRPSTLKESRRPSTTVDDNGCVITKGFVIPSRSSSFDSIATASSSSHETPGTPLSPIEEPTPGYSRPSGSLYHAPELQCIKDQSSRSLHRPARSAGSIEFGARPKRPSVGVRRSTWQQPSSRLSDEDLLNAKCKFSSGLAMGLAQQTALAPLRQTTLQFHKSEKPLHRSRTEPLELNKQKGELEKTAQHGQSSKRKDSKLDCVNEPDSAIASDSEDDEESCVPITGRAVSGITAQRLRPNYAARRAMRDERAAQQQQAQASTHHESTPVKVDFALMYQAESAIESDEEEDDQVTAALDLARIHRSRNSVTASIASDQSTEAAKADANDSEPECSSTSAPRAKFMPFRIKEESCETPTETRSFGPESPIAHRPLRPSRSQPRPLKGVLKNSYSRGSSPSNRNLQVVDATTRRGSAPNITGPSKPSAPVAQKSRSALALTDLSVRFTTAA